MVTRRCVRWQSGANDLGYSIYGRQNSISTQNQITQRIHIIRAHKVMLDIDLAELYDVPTKVLNQAVKINLNKFPADFMFRLTNQEVIILRLQFVTSSLHGGRRFLPHAFTEYGAIMLASVLKSERAVEMSILVVRAFIELRNVLSTHHELAKNLSELDEKVSGHDSAIAEIVEAIRQLMMPPKTSKRSIGFTANI